MTTTEKKNPDSFLVAGRGKLRFEVLEHLLQQKMLQGPGRSNQRRDHRMLHDCEFPVIHLQAICQLESCCLSEFQSLEILCTFETELHLQPLKPKSLCKLFTSVFSINILCALVAEKMLFMVVQSSSSNLKGFLDICDKQQSDSVFYCIFYMASAQSDPAMSRVCLALGIQHLSIGFLSRASPARERQSCHTAWAKVTIQSINRLLS